jgi:hypothetical protein
LIPIFTVCKPSTLLLIFSCVAVIEVSTTLLGELEVAVEIWQTVQVADKMDVNTNVYRVLASNS